jgi:hypothetical protein
MQQQPPRKKNRFTFADFARARESARSATDTATATQGAASEAPIAASRKRTPTGLGREPEAIKRARQDDGSVNVNLSADPAADVDAEARAAAEPAARAFAAAEENAEAEAKAGAVAAAATPAMPGAAAGVASGAVLAAIGQAADAPGQHADDITSEKRMDEAPETNPSLDCATKTSVQASGGDAAAMPDTEGVAKAPGPTGAAIAGEPVLVADADTITQSKDALELNAPSEPKTDANLTFSPPKKKKRGRGAKALVNVEGLDLDSVLGRNLDEYARSEEYHLRLHRVKKQYETGRHARETRRKEEQRKEAKSASEKTPYSNTGKAKAATASGNASVGKGVVAGSNTTGCNAATTPGAEPSLVVPMTAAEKKAAKYAAKKAAKKKAKKDAAALPKPTADQDADDGIDEDDDDKDGENGKTNNAGAVASNRHVPAASADSSAWETTAAAQSALALAAEPEVKEVAEAAATDAASASTSAATAASAAMPAVTVPSAAADFGLPNSSGPDASPLPPHMQATIAPVAVDVVEPLPVTASDLNAGSVPGGDHVDKASPAQSENDDAGLPVEADVGSNVADVAAKVAAGDDILTTEAR